MNDHVDDVVFHEYPAEHSDKPEQSAALLEEIKALDEKMRDPNYKTYTKSAYWHQQAGLMDEAKKEPFQKDLIEYLLRIEAILTKIETLLEKQK